jgi:uncharacterized membrane protein
MRNLVTAAGFFLLIHFGIAGTRLRDAVVTRIGEGAYRIVFSVLSLVGIVWLVGAYARAPFELLWAPSPLAMQISLGVVLIAFLLAVPGLLTPNPTTANFESRLKREDVVQGIIRVTRHPFLWGTALWSGMHLITNGDVASVIVYGSFLFLTLAGTLSIDTKRRRRFGPAWERFEQATSNVPFAAIFSGRNRLALGEIGWWRLALAVLAYAVLLTFHARWFGASPLPH